MFKKDHPRYYPLIVCGFRTGMRMGELIGLRWDRIDFDNRTIHVVDNIAWGRKTTPKNRSGRMVRMTYGGKTPHDMRHSYATFRLSQGHPIAEVAKELGHSDPEITYRIYYQWIPDMSRSDIDGLD